MLAKGTVLTQHFLERYQVMSLELCVLAAFADDAAFKAANSAESERSKLFETPKNSARNFLRWAHIRRNVLVRLSSNCKHILFYEQKFEGMELVKAVQCYLGEITPKLQVRLGHLRRRQTKARGNCAS